MKRGSALLLFPLIALIASTPVSAKEKGMAKPVPPAASPAATEAEDGPALSQLTSDEEFRLAQLLREGVEALDKGALEIARLKFNKALEVDPRSIKALVNLGSVEYRGQNFEAAEKVLRRATRLSPGSFSAWLTLGVVAHDANKLDLAFAALAQAVLLDPSSATAHAYLGVTLGRKGWLDGAEAELLKALSLDETSRDAHFNLAVICLQKKPAAIALARRHYQRALDLGAKRDEVIEKRLGQTDKSVE